MAHLMSQPPSRSKQDVQHTVAAGIQLQSKIKSTRGKDGEKKMIIVFL